MVKRYNHNYVIYKKYNITDINKLLKKDKLPDNILYHEKDYKDSLRRMKILDELISRDGKKYFMEFFYDVKKDMPILLYCDDGSRSKIAGRILSEMGYENLFYLKKGINQWERKVF